MTQTGCSLFQVLHMSSMQKNISFPNWKILFLCCGNKTFFCQIAAINAQEKLFGWRNMFTKREIL